MDFMDPLATGLTGWGQKGGHRRAEMPVPAPLTRVLTLTLNKPPSRRPLEPPQNSRPPGPPACHFHRGRVSPAGRELWRWPVSSPERPRLCAQPGGWRTVVQADVGVTVQSTHLSGPHRGPRLLLPGVRGAPGNHRHPPDTG